MAIPVKGRMHKIKIRNRKDADGKISVGANMEILIDDKPLKGVSFFKFEVKARNVAKVQLEMFCEVDIELDTKLVRFKDSRNAGEKEIPVTVNGKVVNTLVEKYHIGNYEPYQVVPRNKKRDPEEKG